MQAALICPNPDRFARCFHHRVPAALVPMLGQTLLERAIWKLVHLGAKTVHVLVCDRPAEVRQAVSGGAAWGITVNVIPVQEECSIPQARQLLRADSQSWLSAPDDVSVLCNWPEMLHLAGLLPTTEAWFESLLVNMAEAGKSTVGMRELSPEVWVGTQARISQKATLHPPCWIGQHAVIAAGTIIGPHAIVEEQALVDEGAEVVDSLVAPSTYVGPHLELRDSIAVGSRLENWRTGSITTVPDPILLHDLDAPLRTAVSSLLGRLLALASLLPLLLLCPLWYLYSRLQQRPALQQRRVVHTPVDLPATHLQTFTLWQLNSSHTLLRRLPELWSIFRGHMAWFGNRPLTLSQTEQLVTEQEQLWLTVPPGLLSWADTLPCDAEDPSSIETTLHAAYYAVSRSWRLHSRILLHTLCRDLLAPPSSSPDPFPETTINTSVLQTE